jgi:hypothetical protein
MVTGVFPRDFKADGIPGRPDGKNAGRERSEAQLGMEDVWSRHPWQGVGCSFKRVVEYEFREKDEESSCQASEWRIVVAGTCLGGNEKIGWLESRVRNLGAAKIIVNRKCILLKLPKQVINLLRSSALCMRSNRLKPPILQCHTDGIPYSM